MDNNFSLSISDFNLVSETGLPEDGEWCFIVIGDDESGYIWSVGAYYAEDGNFWVNFGGGGLVSEGKDVIAWKSFNDAAFRF